MKKHKLLLDPIQYKIKPIDEEIKRWETELNDRILQQIVEVEIEKLAEAISRGQTWMAGYLEDGRKAENWKSQSVFALNFNNNGLIVDPVPGSAVEKQVNKSISPEQVKGRLEEYGLSFAFAYYTLSDNSSQQNFSFVWQLNETVFCNSLRKTIRLALEELFPEADNCKDAAKLCLGGKSLIETNYSYFLDVDLLFQSARIYSARKVKSNLPRAFDDFDIRIGLKQEEKREIPNNILGTAQNSTQFSTYPTDEKDDVKKLEKVNFQQLSNKVKILADFINSGVSLSHPQLVGLATNLIHFKGGERFFKERIKANSNYSSVNRGIITECKKYNRRPANLADFSTYEEDSEYQNLLEAAKLPRGKVVRSQKYQPMKLEVAEQRFEKDFSVVLADPSNSIWIVRKATALGGTRRLHHLEGVTIAFPYHDLKDEVTRESKVNCRATPRIPSNFLRELQEKVDYYFTVGAISKAKKLLRQEIDTNTELADYFDKSQQALSAAETVLTTHTKALHIDFSHDTLIFDEDPISLVLETGTVSLDDLNNLTQAVQNSSYETTLLRLRETVLSGITDTVYSLFHSSQVQ